MINKRDNKRKNWKRK